MRLITKFTLTIAAFGIAVILIFGLIYYSQTVNRFEESTLGRIEKHIQILSTQLRQQLVSEIEAAAIMLNNPLIEETLEESNAVFADLESTTRQELIGRLNEQWMAAEEEGPFIQSYTQNDTAVYFKRQQHILPGAYGEIFLTNRYGAVTASTSKLTTFAHAHKYWWQGAYADGSGTVFIDDRGFDTSVGGYVLGIVVPFKKEGTIIGIIKCNINIIGFLEKMLQYNTIIGENWSLEIARSSGKIVLAKDTEPLSRSVPDEISEQLSDDYDHSGSIRTSNGDFLYIISPAASTVKDQEFVFGGSPQSVDHRQGNEGSHWDFIAFARRSAVHEESLSLLVTMIEVGAVILICTILAAFIISRGLSRSIRRFIPIVEKIGSGNLDLSLPETSRDEVGTFASVFNTMLSRLKSTLTSKEKLEKLVEEKEFLMRELYHRVKNNLLMVSSLIKLKDASLDDTVDLSDLDHQIDTILIAYEKLYKSEEITCIHTKEYFEDLVDTVVSAIGKDSLDLHMNIAETTVPAATAIYIGLLINEILTNAVKHGAKISSNDRFSAAITFIHDKKETEYRLEISNSGPPLPEDIDFDNTGTMGFKLIKALVKQINGKLELKRAPHPVFSISIPAGGVYLV